jgi:hypothetical protein
MIIVIFEKADILLKKCSMRHYKNQEIEVSNFIELKKPMKPFFRFERQDSRKKKLML